MFSKSSSICSNSSCQLTETRLSCKNPDFFKRVLDVEEIFRNYDDFKMNLASSKIFRTFRTQKVCEMREKLI